MGRSTGPLAALATVLIALGILLISPTTLTAFPYSTIFVQRPDITLDAYDTAIPKAASLFKQLPLLERHHDYLPYNSETNTYSCPANNPDGSFCMNVGGFYIIRCHNGVGNPGDCSADLVGRPPIGTGHSPCWDTSMTSGTAVCSKNCIAYPDDRTAPFNVPNCTPELNEHSHAFNDLDERDVDGESTELDPDFTPMPHVTLPPPKPRPKRPPPKNKTKAGEEAPYKLNYPDTSPQDENFTVREIEGADSRIARHKRPNNCEGNPDCFWNDDAEHLETPYYVLSDSDRRSELSDSKELSNSDLENPHFVCVEYEKGICIYGYYTMEAESDVIERGGDHPPFNEISDSNQLTAAEDASHSANLGNPNFVCVVFNSRNGACQYGYWKAKADFDARERDVQDEIHPPFNKPTVGHSGEEQHSLVMYGFSSAAMTIENVDKGCRGMKNIPVQYSACRKRIEEKNKRIICIAIVLGIVGSGLLLLLIFDKIQQAKARRRSASLNHRYQCAQMAERATSNLDGADDQEQDGGWTGWFLNRRANQRHKSPVSRGNAPRIPSLTLPKPTLATVRKFSGLGLELEGGDKDKHKKGWNSDSRVKWNIPV